ncbi:MAG: ABC transporter ATP-binding protein [Candidatus Omnitrophica bacterium]|nr:ABC transporter ATP-binding protein [Candidatus Omnitrophota bacterium]
MLLEIKNLKVKYFGSESGKNAVDGASFGMEKGKVLALVGESACGKTTTALSIARLITSHDGKIEDGEIIFKGKDVMHLSNLELRMLRASEISYIFQDPSSSLNPVYTIGEQIAEILAVHKKIPGPDAKQKVLNALREAHLSDAERIFSAYPHQLSGGMKQRAMIAMAAILKPALLIADEPTSALDVSVQAKIMQLLMELKLKLGLSILFITHNLNLVSEIADNVAVMYNGKIVEACSKDDFYNAPKHEYTKMLISTMKDLNAMKRFPVNSVSSGKNPPQNAPILKANNLKKSFCAGKKCIRAVSGVDINLGYGETLGIVGETGCGKTTLAKLLAGLYRPDEGTILYNGSPKMIRKNIQMVFQHPYDSLNPRMKIGDMLKECLITHKIARQDKIPQRLKALLDMVQLPECSLDRYPHEFSGGERQRIAITRALAVEPKLIILDEPVSSLDVSIQGKILHLLLNLQKELGLSYIFISHDILIVKAISDRIAVMRDGKITEEGPAGQICENPVQEYTKQLMNAASCAILKT